MPAKHRLGNLDLAILSDGLFYADAGATFGIVPRVMWEPLAGDLDDRHRLSLALNSLLLRSQGKLILIETGVGDKAGGWRRLSSPVADGTLVSDLAKLDIAPEEIDIVINTHLHADHCGWNTRLQGDEAVPTFPNAEYFVIEDEWQAALAPNERTRATYLEDNLLPLERYNRLHLVDGEHKLTDEVTIVPAPGHSAGHARPRRSVVGRRDRHLHRRHRPGRGAARAHRVGLVVRHPSHGDYGDEEDDGREGDRRELAAHRLSSALSGPRPHDPQPPGSAQVAGRNAVGGHACLSRTCFTE